jgi:hypothetical protein
MLATISWPASAPVFYARIPTPGCCLCAYGSPRPLQSASDIAAGARVGIIPTDPNRVIMPFPLVGSKDGLSACSTLSRAYVIQDEQGSTHNGEVHSAKMGAMFSMHPALGSYMEIPIY